MTPWVWPDATIGRVIDGDTIDALLVAHNDIGFGMAASVNIPMRLRLARINAPKIASTAGRAAQLRLIELVTTAPVLVTTIKGYKYGPPDEAAGHELVAEYMAEITLPDGRNVSDLLVAEGLAVWWDGRGPRPSDS